MRFRQCLLPASAFFLLVACSSDADTGGSNGGSLGPPPGNAGSGGSTGVPPSSDGGATPPEVELHETFERPQAGEHYVFAANPESDTVAVIDAMSLAISTVETGDRPTYVATVPGSDTALVVNAHSDDVTVVRASESGITTSILPVVPAANSIFVSPDGVHAIVYYDAHRAKVGDPVGTYQDVTIVHIEPGADAAVNMTVGFRPSSVSFSTDANRALVVTEDGISVLDFADAEENGSNIARTVSLDDAGLEPLLDVSVSADARFAIARREGETLLALVDLQSGERKVLDLADVLFAEQPVADAGAEGGAPMDSGSGDAGYDEDSGDAAAVPDSDAALPSPIAASVAGVLPEVSDLDLAPDGSFAVAVVRSHGLLVRLDIPEAFDAKTARAVVSVPGELIGLADLLPDARTVLAYTTADETVERISIVDLFGEAPPRIVQLRKSVRSVLLAPDGSTALIRHARRPGDPAEVGIDLDTQIDRSFGYTLLDVETGFSKLQVTSSDPDRFAALPDSSAIYMLFDDPVLRVVERAELRGFQIARFQLGSRPMSLGNVPQSRKVFVSQEHTDGRIAFIDWVTGDIRSVTGFELNSRIRE